MLEKHTNPNPILKFLQNYVIFKLSLVFNFQLQSVQHWQPIAECTDWCRPHPIGRAPQNTFSALIHRHRRNVWQCALDILYLREVLLKFCLLCNIFSTMLGHHIQCLAPGSGYLVCNILLFLMGLHRAFSCPLLCLFLLWSHWLNLYAPTHTFWV